jgi:hypothetical protein
MLTIDKNGVLYGTTLYGGNPGCLNQWGCGTIFGLTPPSSPGGAWTETVLRSLPNVNHYNEARLAIGENGTIYGVTIGDGADHKGSVFELTPPAVPGGAWMETTLYSFTAAAMAQARIAWSPARTARCTASRI